MKFIAYVANIIAILMLSINVCAASVEYSYTGNNYSDFYPWGSYGENIYDSTMRLEVTFTTDNLLISYSGDARSLITSFMVHDGVNSLTESDFIIDDYHGFSINTDSSGNILEWRFLGETILPVENLGDTRVQFYSDHIEGIKSDDWVSTVECVTKPFGECVKESYNAYSIENPGSWSVSQVPIPQSIWLLVSGVLGLIGISRRKKV